MVGRLSLGLAFGLSLALAAAGAGCSSDGNDGGLNGFPDAAPGDGGVEDAGMMLVIEFDRERIEGQGIGAPLSGDNAALELNSAGAPTVAYGAIPEATMKYEVHYAERGTDGTWTSELVAVPGAMEPTASGQIIGLGLAHVGGVPHVVYLGGDGDNVVLTPFPTDLILATKNGANWTERTIADRSNDAPGVCPGTQDTCNFGNVVGSHCAIAANPGGNGFAVIYRDTHGGFARDDLARSDVEVYAEGGPVMRACVDPVRSGGGFGNITYTQAGNLVLAYNLETQSGPEPRTGVWAAAYDGAMWNTVRVSDSQAASKIALETAADGTIWMAFSHANDNDLAVAKSMDGGMTWMLETPDTDGKTGLHPDLAFDLQGRVVVAYGYCGRQSDTECPGRLGARSQVRLARLEGSEWKIYMVDDGQGFGKVGLFNQVVVTPDGKLGVAFVDDQNGDLLYAREL